MKLKAIEVSFELIEQALTTGHEVEQCRILEGVPEGAKLVRVDQEGNLQGDGWQPERAVLYFEHDSFAELDPAAEPERIVATVETLDPTVKALEAKIRDLKAEKETLLQRLERYELASR